MNVLIFLERLLLFLKKKIVYLNGSSIPLKEII